VVVENGHETFHIGFGLHRARIRLDHCLWSSSYLVHSSLTEATMPRAAVRGAAGLEPDVQSPGGDRVDPASPTARETSAVTGQDGNSSRKRRQQDQPASELRYPRRRSLKACRLCRARKTKCDNVHPTCGFCSSIGATCSYDGGESNYSS
jgi:hypothetical protein